MKVAQYAQVPSASTLSGSRARIDRNFRNGAIRLFCTQNCSAFLGVIGDLVVNAQFLRGCQNRSKLQIPTTLKMFSTLQAGRKALRANISPPASGQTYWRRRSSGGPEGCREGEVHRWTNHFRPKSEHRVGIAPAFRKQADSHHANREDTTGDCLLAVLQHSGLTSLIAEAYFLLARFTRP